MILQKLAQAIQRQDWFQVVVEVLIVIVGIFLGLQVQGYYEDRADREMEYRYLVKLHNETLNVALQADRFMNSRIRISENLSELSRMLIEKDDGSNFRDEHCVSLTYSHIYISGIGGLPTLIELLASGQILLIQSENIKGLISELALLTDRVNALMNSLHADKLDIARKYPQTVNLMSVKMSRMDSFGENAIVECDYQRMLDHVEFKNDLISNNSRFSSYNALVSAQIDTLRSLHKSLDEELGINHD